MLHADPNAPTARARLRVLATTDLHGTMLAHDYIKDQPAPGTGLAGLAHLIAQARHEAIEDGRACVLFDNGDTFQGTPLATWLAQADPSEPNCIVDTFNHLRYTAVGVGNHDFDHGQPYLAALAGRLGMPILTSNLSGVDLTPLESSALIDVPLDGHPDAPLRIGLLSVLPQETANWHRHHLGAALEIEDPGPFVRKASAHLRTRGADIIIVLAHMGAGYGATEEPRLRGALAIAQTNTVDAMIIGHTHRRLPSLTYEKRIGIDSEGGTLAGVPAVMPGHNGSDLGLIDIEMQRGPQGGWQIATAQSALRPQHLHTPPDPDVSAICTPAHIATQRALEEPVAQIGETLHSCFSLLTPAPTQRLIARAMHLLAQQQGLENSLGGLPIIAATAAHGTGGRDGPENYVQIAPGVVRRRHIAGLVPFNDQLMCVRTSGHAVREWLEHSASLFHTIQPRDESQPLLNPDVPAFQYDTIFGLRYRIDLSRKPGERIGDMMCNGIPLRDDDRFALLTTQFRVAGGGNYPGCALDDILHHDLGDLPRALAFVLRTDPADPWSGAVPWSFAALGARPVHMDISPQAQAHFSDIAHLAPSVQGMTENGFARLQVIL
ncbi:bifunctional UDP-sugar hydrolase/5'-nucleotidase [Sulfitobacter sp. S190]|uniref:bifunctional metallophosphatase/5'-nucleotidase n=1 Tax=Sulfitobacter sp. S190 TaxID=2867022 RepID=UPI0021A93913|nr:5'-nucleotidase C-terminal domain-containing protein [Sulfitobacter sp. S190]UWR22828.1 5'-nucleotidase C-terminal domain-containing protein [Sulfitobacter sp. S190]